MTESAAFWKQRAEQFQRERAELHDKLNGTPCAEIRWQQEKEALEADRDRLARELEEATKFVEAADRVIAKQRRELEEARSLLLDASIHLEEWPGGDDESQREKANRIATEIARTALKGEA